VSSYIKTRPAAWRYVRRRWIREMMTNTQCWGQWCCYKLPLAATLCLCNCCLLLISFFHPTSPLPSFLFLLPKLSMCPPLPFSPSLDIYLNAPCGVYIVPVWPFKVWLISTGALSSPVASRYQRGRCQTALPEGALLHLKIIAHFLFWYNISRRQSSFYFGHVWADYFVQSFCLLYGHSEAA